MIESNEVGIAKKIDREKGGNGNHCVGCAKKKRGIQLRRVISDGGVR